MKYLILMTLLILASSCDLELEDEKQEPEVRGLNEYLIGQRAEVSRALNSEEVRIGNAVCEAFAAMRLDVQPSVDVNYKISEKNCNGVSTTPVIVPAKIYSDGDSMLSREGRVHFRDVLSDKHSLLKEVCQNLDVRGSSTDTFDVSANRKVQIRFKVLSNRYYVQVIDFVNNVSNKIHTALVATKDTANGLEGMTIMRALSKSCSNSRNVYSYTQELSL